MGRCVLDLVGESLVGVLQPHTISKDGDLHVHVHVQLFVGTLYFYTCTYTATCCVKYLYICTCTHVFYHLRQISHESGTRTQNHPKETPLQTCPCVSINYMSHFRDNSILFLVSHYLKSSLCNSDTCSEYLSSAMWRFVIVSLASNIAVTHVFFLELGFWMFNI